MRVFAPFLNLDYVQVASWSSFIESLGLFYYLVIVNMIGRFVFCHLLRRALNKDLVRIFSRLICSILFWTIFIIFNVTSEFGDSVWHVK